jgi:hypothetical protein
MTTVTFNPINYGFRWTEDWYEYDGKVAEDAAKKARDDYAAELKRDGYTVKKRSRRNNLISRGGIGSGHPHIELVVPVYSVVTIERR